MSPSFPGARAAPPPERYELHMRHRTGRDLRAVAADFEALLELREQLQRLGYGLVRLVRG